MKAKLPVWHRFLTPTLLLLAVGSPSAGAQTRQVSQQPAGRVVSLQAFEALEARVAALERRLAEAPSAPAAPISVEKARWRMLREDMSPDEVRAILGEPVQLDGGSTAHWYYSTKGIVGPNLVFIMGKLYRWEEPR